MNDNVRKIFNMLGVEPNEKFKIRDLEEIYFIDNDLCLRNEEKEFFPSVFLILLRDPLRIIKFPKKKKLRDLTPEEYKKWSEKNCEPGNCDKCIFRNVSCLDGGSCWVKHKDIYSDKFLEQEVKVK